MAISSIPASMQPKPSLEMICPYEPGKPLDEVRRELGLTTIVKLASNENPLGPSPAVITTLNQTNLGLHLYPDYEGWYLREDLSARIGFPVNQIMLGSGSAELLRILGDARLDRGDEAIIADVTFPIYANVVRLAGAKPVVVPLTEDLQYDLVGMRAAVNERTKLVFIASPNNPTGRLLPCDQIYQFVKDIPAGVTVALDLAYWEYVDEAEAKDLMGLVHDHPNVVVLRTFSKAYGLAGLRIGFALAAPEVIGWMAKVRNPFSTSTVAQVAARIALTDHDHIRRCVELNRLTRDMLMHGLAQRGCHCWPSQANFVLADVRRDSEWLFSSLLRRGIVVRPMRHPRLSTCVRITTGTEDQIRLLLEELPRVMDSYS